MTFPVLLVLSVVVLAVVGLSTELVATEVVACLVIGILAASGVLDPSQALAGFGNPALMMIAGLMILTGGLIHNGAADRISRAIGRMAGARESRALALLLGSVAFLSAWINNTAATAMFVPVAEGISKRHVKSVSRYLMPVAFASMLGGCITLIGTSTNIAVSGKLHDFGMAPISMFELAPVGLLVALLGLAYLTLWQAPDRAAALNRAEAFDIKKYLFELQVAPGSPYAGRTLERCEFLRTHELTVLAIERGPDRLLSPGAHEAVRAGDLLLVEGDLRGMVSLKGVAGVEIHSSHAPLTEKDITSEQVKLVEATISYNSPLIGWTLKGVGFRQRYGLNVLALRRRGDVLVEMIARIRLKAGDVLLLQGSDDAFRRLAQEPPALLLEDVVLPVVDPKAELVSTVIFLVTILATSLGILDGAISCLLGSAAMVLFRTLTVQNAYQYLNLRLVVLVASMFALGDAMKSSGAADLLADQAISLIGPDSPNALLLAICVVTVMLTQPMNNAAAALLVLPVAMRAAALSHVDPRPFAIGITLAASCSFITPFEPSCILIWDTGKYRFFDFLRLGLPLTVLAVACIVISVPLFWPF